MSSHPDMSEYMACHPGHRPYSLHKIRWTMLNISFHRNQEVERWWRWLREYWSPQEDQHTYSSDSYNTPMDNWNCKMCH